MRSEYLASCTDGIAIAINYLKRETIYNDFSIISASSIMNTKLKLATNLEHCRIILCDRFKVHKAK